MSSATIDSDFVGDGPYAGHRRDPECPGRTSPRPRHPSPPNPSTASSIDPRALLKSLTYVLSVSSVGVSVVMPGGGECGGGTRQLAQIADRGGQDHRLAHLQGFFGLHQNGGAYCSRTTSLRASNSRLLRMP